MKTKPTHSKMLFTIGLLVLIFISISAIFALTATNSVAESGLSYNESAITAEQLKPDACNSLLLSDVNTSGSGGAANELMLGSAAADTLDGADGNDCLVAGDGDDTLDGGLGDDICIGGQGTNSFVNCETIIDP